MANLRTRFEADMTRLRLWLRQWQCGLFGHCDTLELSFDRIWLRCTACGYESRGVRLQIRPEQGATDV